MLEHPNVGIMGKEKSQKKGQESSDWDLTDEEEETLDNSDQQNTVEDKIDNSLEDMVDNSKEDEPQPTEGLGYDSDHTHISINIQDHGRQQDISVKDSEIWKMKDSKLKESSIS